MGSVILAGKTSLAVKRAIRFDGAKKSTSEVEPFAITPTIIEFCLRVPLAGCTGRKFLGWTNAGHFIETRLMAGLPKADLPLKLPGSRDPHINRCRPKLSETAVAMADKPRVQR